MNNLPPDQAVLADDFADLAHAALRISGRLISSMSPEQSNALEGAVQAGAKLSIEFGPLPAFERVLLVMTEHEGLRQIVCGAELRKGSLQ